MAHSIEPADPTLPSDSTTTEREDAINNGAAIIARLRDRKARLNRTKSDRDDDVAVLETTFGFHSCEVHPLFHCSEDEVKVELGRRYDSQAALQEA